MILVLACVFVVGTLCNMMLWRRLRRSQGRFRLLAENSNDLVCLHNRDGRYEYISPAVERLLGYTAEELVGRHPRTLIHPDDACLIGDASAVGAEVRTTYRILRKDDRYIWFETLTRPIMADGNTVSLVTTSRDVTEAKQAEILYRTLAANLPDTAVLLFNSECRVLVADGGIIGRNGYTRERVEGWTPKEVFSDAIASESISYWTRALAGEQVRVEAPFEGALYDIRIFPVGSEIGVPAGMVVATDITAQKMQEQFHRERSEDLERSNRDLEQFADVASHELKAPLRRISSFVELLSDEHEGLLSAAADEYIGHVVTGVREMQGVIEALITYSRTKPSVRMQHVDLNAIMVKILETLQPRVESAGAHVEVTHLPRVVGDPVLLRQLMENLLNNAIKFTASTGVKPIVRVYAERDLTVWRVCVVDNGPGVDDESKGMLFQMFKRTMLEVEGSGIGLALCKKIVGIHRGKIWVEDALGGGSKFVFTLPARTTTLVPD